MRKSRILLSLGSALVALSQMVAVAQITAPPFSITTEARNDVVKAGSTVELSVRLRNTSQHDINAASAWMNDTNISYLYDVHDVNGNVPNEKQHDEFRGHLVSQALKPGEKKNEKILLSAIYD